jgi:hypothetical protein
MLGYLLSPYTIWVILRGETEIGDIPSPKVHSSAARQPRGIETLTLHVSQYTSQIDAKVDV